MTIKYIYQYTSFIHCNIELWKNICLKIEINYFSQIKKTHDVA